MKQWRVVVSLLLTLIVVIFAVLNIKSVPISFGFAQVSLPLVIVIIGSLVIGALITFLVASVNHFSQYREHKKLQQKVTKLQSDNDAEVAKIVKDKTADLQAQLQVKDDEIKALKAQLQNNNSDLPSNN